MKPDGLTNGELQKASNLRRVLVTGGGGFLGQAIVKLLRKKAYEIRSFSRSTYPELENLQVEQVQGDISDANAVEQACKGMDLVFHVAAKTGVWGNYRSYFATNVIGTQNVIAACMARGISYLVHTSSPSVAYNENAVQGADESLPYPSNYLTNYQKTKFLAEQAVVQASSKTLKTIVLRPRLIWGPGENQMIPRIIARANRLVQVGENRNLIDTIYVDNAAEAHVLAAEKLQQNHALSGNIYFISQDQPIYCWEMINRILEAAGKSPVKRSIPAGLAYALGAVMEIIFKLLRLSGEPQMTRFLSRELSQSHYFNINAAKKDLGYVPRVSIDEGFERLKLWFESESPH